MSGALYLGGVSFWNIRCFLERFFFSYNKSNVVVQSVSAPFWHF